MQTAAFESLAGVAGESALVRFARRRLPPAEPLPEKCDLCGAPMAADHRHLLDVAARKVLCACRPCAILFDRDAASEGRCRLIPDRRVWLADFDMDDAAWERLGIPVKMACVFHSTPAAGPIALFPGPVGATEALVEQDGWVELAARNPVLATLAPDVEALLVNRARGASDHFIAPIDDCFRLTAVIRGSWRGLAGGHEVWGKVEEFFAGLRESSMAAVRGANE